MMITNSVDLDEISERVIKACDKRGWDKDWSRGGCYLHLEASEFIEALRGKGSDDPEKEAADVLITFCALVGNYKLNCRKIVTNLYKILKDIEDGTVGSIGNT